MEDKQKQHLIDMMKSDEELGLYEEPKQETTIEESNQTTAIRFLEWYRRNGVIYQFHHYHVPYSDDKYLNARQLFEIFEKENYEK